MEQDTLQTYLENLTTKTRIVVETAIRNNKRVQNLEEQVRALVDALDRRKAETDELVSTLPDGVEEDRRNADILRKDMAMKINDIHQSVKKGSDRADAWNSAGKQAVNLFLSKIGWK
jgi:hypothetical protein